MGQITFNHLTRCNETCLTADPLIIEFLEINVTDDMDQMQVGIFPELQEVIPVLILVILNGNPSVVIPVGSIIRKRAWAFAVLQMNNPVCIV